MTHWTRRTWLVLPAVLLASIVLVGCSGKDEDFGDRKARKKSDKEDDKKTEEVAPPAAGLKPIQGKGVATLKGTIKLVGDDPDYAALTKALMAEIDKAVNDKPTCLAGSDPEKSQFSWVVDKTTHGVKNVFVWMRPVDDKTEFFDVKALVDQVKGFDKVKKIDQPHCAFEPHAVVVFPRYVDPAKPSNKYGKGAAQGGPPSTGQEFLVTNTGTLLHNTSSDGDAGRMRSLNTAVPPGSKVPVTDLQPSYKGNGNVTFKCSVHSWMKSVIWAFDHPFACVTGSKVNDKELPMGEYRIENIPAGVKLRVVAWHEVAFFLNGGELGEEITLKEGENTKDFTISVRK